MQRQSYAPGPAHSPPLHHPVPQHVSTVPMMRSPPPPAGETPQGYSGTPYGANMNQHQQNGGQFVPAFGGFVNDQTAAMGVQLGKSAFNVGQQYMDQNLKSYISSGALKHYFNVTTSYVVRKIFLVLFPWRHKPWSRQQRPSMGGAQDQNSYYFLPPREDVNSPDMYIPVMAFVTYILLATLLAGLRGSFHPEVMGQTFGWAISIVVLEILILKLGTYILSITNESQLLDLIAYSGYKFVGVIVTLMIAEALNAGQGTGGVVGWVIFGYTYSANSFFLLRSLKYVLLPDSSGPAGPGMTHTVARAQRNRRTQFLFIYAYILQLVCMWILCSQDSAVAAPVTKAKVVGA